MRTFTIIWIGQLVSTIGTYMTDFAIAIWAWEITGSATALALVSFFSQLPRIPITLFAGAIVDRFNRKHLMILGDTIAVLSSIAILVLHLSNNLEIWHLYLTGAFNFTKPGLYALLIVTSLFWFAHDLGGALYDPMILARTGGNAQALGSVASAAGVGGVTGALIVSTWGGPKRRIHGMLLGFIGAGLSKTVFGLGQAPLIWIPAQFCSSLNFPLLSSSETGIWLAKVAPDLQGRVFAAQLLILQVVSVSGTLIAGPIADYVLEPAMMPGGILAPILGGIFGIGRGAGMAILYVTTSICLLLVGIGGYAFPLLREVEDTVPDHDAAAM